MPKEKETKVTLQLRSLINAVRKAREKKQRMTYIKGFTITTKAGEETIELAKERGIKQKQNVTFVVVKEHKSNS